MFRFIAAAKSIFFGRRRVVVIPPTPPATDSIILTEAGDFLNTEASDRLITET